MKRFLMFITVAIVFSLTVLLTQESLAITAGFSSGNQFKSIPIQGTLNMTCQNPVGGAPRLVTFYCRDGILDPSEADYFVGPMGDADTVTLTANREDGSQRIKAVSYDGKVGKSKSQFNLWIASLLQRPLLGDGTNSIHYVLSKGSTAITQGDFTATVTLHSTMTCPTGNIYSAMPSDCDNEFTACGKYFDRYNYCN